MSVGKVLIHVNVTGKDECVCAPIDTGSLVGIGLDDNALSSGCAEIGVDIQERRKFECSEGGGSGPACPTPTPTPSPTPTSSPTPSASPSPTPTPGLCPSVGQEDTEDVGLDEEIATAILLNLASGGLTDVTIENTGSATGCSQTSCISSDDSLTGQYELTGTLSVPTPTALGTITGTASLCGNLDSSSGTFTFNGPFTGISPSGIECIEVVGIEFAMDQ